jgi:hypothetical protein
VPEQVHKKSLFTTQVELTATARRCGTANRKKGPK